MTTEAFQHRLRLVRPPAALRVEPDAASGPSRDHASRARMSEVEKANRAAAAATTDTTRDIFASRVAESLEGGKSAILRPDRRATLVDLASRMGIRAFDAHLVIALTQDAARQGEIATGRREAAYPKSGRPDQGRTALSTTENGPAWLEPSYLAIATGIVLGTALAMLAIVWIGAN